MHLFVGLVEADESGFGLASLPRGHFVSLRQRVSLMKEHLFVPQPREEAVSPAALVPALPGAKKASGISVKLPSGTTPCTNIINGEVIQSNNDGFFVFFERGIFKISWPGLFHSFAKIRL